ncbi:hypothetical protein P4E94_18650 [Pontiellaceae bacterium B12219]|nr:hypothetical protein [Pontiellaceae bacterium B12219]
MAGKLKVFAVCLAVACRLSATVVEVDSLKALAEYAHKDNVTVRLKPGVYELNDPAMGQEMDMATFKYGWDGRHNQKVSLLHFSANNSFYDLTDTQINLDTKLHAAFGKREILEVFISGDSNMITGMTVIDVGEVAPAHGCNMMAIIGDDNTVENSRFYVHGSTPYGYGHLLGKGAGAYVPLRKHCGVLIAGQRTKFINNIVKQYAFGHGIYLQGAVDTLIKGCYVEGEMRTTDDMLKEKSGLAYDVGFKSHYPPGKIVPGQIKTLAEDGIRTYASGGFVAGRRTARVTVENCTTKNMRCGVCLGFEQGPSKIINCTALEYQERGYSIGTDGVIENSRGDAMYGPLLTFLGAGAKNCKIDLELMPAASRYPVPRVLEVNGTGHTITVRNYEGRRRQKTAPIVFGESDWGDIHLFRAPDSDPRKYSGAYDCTVTNLTGMPIVFSELSSGNKVVMNGKVERDRGTDNQVEKDNF